MRAAALVSLLVLAALCSAGCRPRGRTVTPAVARTYQDIAHGALEDLHCDHADGTHLVLPGVVQVRGCGERREYVVPTRRAPAVPIAPVEQRAARELRCAPTALRVESPAPTVRGVTGCERRARYDLLCRGRECEWTMTAHTGAWAGMEGAAPEALPAAWSGPPTAGGEDLSEVALPPPPAAGAEPVIPPPPSP